MKRIQNIANIVILLLLFVACNRDNSPQQIHQQINFYIYDKNGNDLLDSDAGMNYFRRVTFLDLNDERADVPINGITYERDNTNKNFIKYLAGAKRIMIRRDKNSEIYLSDFIIRYNKHDNDNKTMGDDTLHIVYSLTPSIFKIKEVRVDNKVYNANTNNISIIIEKQ